MEECATIGLSFVIWDFQQISVFRDPFRDTFFTRTFNVAHAVSPAGSPGVPGPVLVWRREPVKPAGETPALLSISFSFPPALFLLKSQRVFGLLWAERATVRHYAEPAFPVL